MPTSGYRPRTAGPPMLLGDMLVWTVISVAAYLCFIVFPGRLRRRPSAAASLVGWDDLVWVGSHLHLCLWTWPVHDLLLRGISLALLPLDKLRDLMPNSESNQVIVQMFRSALGTNDDAVAARYTHRHAVVASVAVMLTIWLLVTVQYFTRPAWRERHPKAPSNSVKSSGSKVAPPPATALSPFAAPYVPVVSWMVLWSLGFSTLFAWVKATPLLMTQLYPVGVCLLTVYMMLVP